LPPDRETTVIDPIVEFLLEPQRLALALEIASKRDAVARYIVNTYWRNVANVITERLPPNDLGDWVFESTGRAEEKHSGIAFAINVPGVTEDTDERYVNWIGYNALACNPEETYLGVCRGTRFAALAEPTQALEAKAIERLKTLNVKRPGANFLGWQHARKLGVAAGTVGDDAFLLALNDDIRNPARPAATKTADVLLEIFAAIRPFLKEAADQLLSSTSAAAFAGRRSTRGRP
jgi:hypothetical protein